MASTIDPDQVTAIQAVVDRVSSYQDTASDGTLDAELRKGLDEAGLQLQDEQISALVAAIEADAGEADAGDALG